MEGECAVLVAPRTKDLLLQAQKLLKAAVSAAAHEDTDEVDAFIETAVEYVAYGLEHLAEYEEISREIEREDREAEREARRAANA
jgi:hypothetical protein